MGQTHPTTSQHALSNVFEAMPQQRGAAPRATPRAADAAATDARCCPGAAPMPRLQAPSASASSSPAALPMDGSGPHGPRASALGAAGAGGAHLPQHPSHPHAPLNTLDLDRLFHEGDDRTWDIEEWSWDPTELVAAPNGVPTLNPCQVSAIAPRLQRYGTSTLRFASPQLAAASSAGMDSKAHLLRTGSGLQGRSWRF
jgi:hypothetical protein